MVLTATLIVLVWYAYDTNRIAHVTAERWEREGILSTTYEMKATGTPTDIDIGATLMSLRNGSPLVM